MTLAHSRHAVLVLFVSLLVFGVSRDAAAVTTCADICPPTGVCNITSQKQIDPGSVVDCSGRDIVVKATVKVTGGRFELIANDLTVNKFKRIEAVESEFVEVGFDLTLTGTLDVQGRLQARNKGGDSTIEIQAGGDLIMDNGPGIDMIGTTESADGGELFVQVEGTATLRSNIKTDGKLGGTSDNVNIGGDIYIEASGGSVIVGATISAIGRRFGGGLIELYARDGDLIIESGGTVDSHGDNDESDGGIIYLEGDNSMVIDGEIYADGGRGSNGGTATGGEVILAAGCGGLEINGLIDVSAGEGGGGDISTQIVTGPVVVSGTVKSNGLRYDGDGGSIHIWSSDDDLTLTPTAVIESRGDLTTESFSSQGGSVLLSGCQLDMQGLAPGNGAVINMSSPGGGRASLSGAKNPLAPLGFGDFSLRVSEFASVDVSATDGVSTLPRITLSTDPGAARDGFCAFQPNVACTVDAPTCTIGWTAYDCLDAEPNTDGRMAQFSNPPVISTEPAADFECGPCL